MDDLKDVIIEVTADGHTPNSPSTAGVGAMLRVNNFELKNGVLFLDFNESNFNMFAEEIARLVPGVKQVLKQKSEK